MVEIAAPFIPYLGTRYKFRKMLNMAVTTIFESTSLDFPTMLRDSLDTLRIEEKKKPRERILNADSAMRYSEPNKIVIISPENMKTKISTGRFIMNIHFPTCSIKVRATLKFFLEYSFAANGNKRAMKSSVAMVNKKAIGIAAL